MWFLPTFRRPDRCRATLASIVAAGGANPGAVIINGDDPAYDDLEVPPGWRAFHLAANVGLSGALDWAFHQFPAEPWYGFISDDSLVRTPGFDRPLVDAAGPAGFATSGDGWQAGRRMHGAVVFGGELLRALGWWAPPGLRHAYIDDAWETIARALDNWRHVPQVLVEHMHPGVGKAPDDATYADAYSTFDADRARFRAMLRLELPAAIERAIPVVGGAPERRRLARARSRRVMIGTPVARAPTLEYTTSFAETCVHLDRTGIAYASQFVIGSSNLPRARNEIVARFLASDCTDLIFADDDMGWRPEAIVRLLASDKPVIAGVGRKRVDKPNSDPDVWCVHFLDGADRALDQDEMGAIEVAAVGTGLMKIERRVFERLIAAHPEWKRDGHDGMPADVRAAYHQFFRFDPDDVTEMGEDIVFCHRWRAARGSVWIDPTFALTHTGTKTWSGCISELLVAGGDRELGGQTSEISDRGFISPNEVRAGESLPSLQ